MGVKVGSRVFEFIADEDIVFSKRSDDRDILFLMLSGASTSFKLHVDGNPMPVKFFISLAGFKNAYNYIAKRAIFITTQMHIKIWLEVICYTDRMIL